MLNNKEFEPMSDIDMLYIGVYWKNKNNDNKMIKYYSAAIDLKNITAMINLAIYYKKISKFDHAIKYFLMAITTVSNKIINSSVQITNIDDISKYGSKFEKEFNISWDNLACNFKKVSEFVNNDDMTNNDNTNEYYLIAIKYRDAVTMNNLLNYYKKISNFGIDKYYLMVIENGYAITIFRLAGCYENISNYDDAIKYYSIASKNDHIPSTYWLASLYAEKEIFRDAIKYYSMATEHGWESAYTKFTNIYLNKKNCDIFDENFFAYLNIKQYKLTGIFEKN